MHTFIVRTTYGTQTEVKADTLVEAIERYCLDWREPETTIRAIERKY